MKSNGGVVVGLVGIGLLLFVVVVGITLVGQPQQFKAGWFEDQVQGDVTAGDLRLLASPSNEDELFEVSHVAPAPEHNRVTLRISGLVTRDTTIPPDSQYSVNATSNPQGVDCWRHMLGRDGQGENDGYAATCERSFDSIDHFTLTAWGSDPHVVPASLGWGCVDQSLGEIASAPHGWTINVNLTGNETVINCDWQFSWAEDIPAPSAQ